jgi:ferric-dicitrate binding protein FerR (iron transport regulator)
MKRYFLSQDNSCHWYLVEAEHREEWEAWRDLDEDDQRAWESPKFAEMLCGSPSRVEFENPLEKKYGKN